jgi:hypothetical protein
MRFSCALKGHAGVFETMYQISEFLLAHGRNFWGIWGKSEKAAGGVILGRNGRVLVGTTLPHSQACIDTAPRRQARPVQAAPFC